jgi:hypothetical protein
LPALMQMLGHKDVRMTLRYVEVVQLDGEHYSPQVTIGVGPQMSAH